MPGLRYLVLTLGIAGLMAGCDDPAQPIELPSDLLRSMSVRLLLVPGTDIQPMWATTLDVSEFGIIGGLSVEVTSEAGVVVRIDSVTEDMAVSDACDDRYGVLALNSKFACVELPFDPTPGRRYRVTVRAADRPTATASVLVPGEFELDEITATGSPPGTERLTATWSRSDSAYAYLVGYSAYGLECGVVNVNGCPDGWFVSTRDTVLETTIPEPTVEPSGGWRLDVFAVDHGLLEYLTTGSGDEFFVVPPVSNVEGGHGFVGAWVHQAYNLGR